MYALQLFIVKLADAVHDDSARVCAHELDSEQKRHSGRYRNGIGEGLRSVSEPFP